MKGVVSKREAIRKRVPLYDALLPQTQRRKGGEKIERKGEGKGKGMGKKEKKIERIKEKRKKIELKEVEKRKGRGGGDSIAKGEERR